MNIFKNTTFTWYQLGAFKWSLFLSGIVVGAYWHDFFAQYLKAILVVAVVLTAYVTVVYFKQR